MRKIRIRKTEEGLETTFYKSDGTVETKTSKPEPLEFVDTFNCEDDNLNSPFSEYSGSTANFEFDDTNKQSELIREFYRLRNVPRDRSVRISELLVEVDRTDVGRKLI